MKLQSGGVVVSRGKERKSGRTPLAGMLRNPALLIGRGTLPQTGGARINPHPGEERGSFDFYYGGLGFPSGVETQALLS
jgi:hypothetical protein